MKISWGYKIAFLYLGFAGFVIYFVTRSINEKIDLVTPDYYAQELKYQDKIESSVNNNKLVQPLEISYNSNGIEIRYPSDLSGKEITGTILVFRPSDNTKDKRYDVAPGKLLTQLIPHSDLEKGMYRVKVDYASGGMNYYTEKQIIILNQ